MSHWRWTRHSSCSFHKSALLGLFALLLTHWQPSHARADAAVGSADTSTGPVSAEEARVLWKDGKDAYDHGMDEDAIPRLERFVARYPGYPDYLEARHVLARAYLRQHEPAKAKAELKSFIQGAGPTPEALQARCELTRADLELKLYSEAVLTANETLKLALKAANRDRRTEALILRARSQMGLNQDTRAEASISSALEMLPVAPALEGQLRVVILDLRLRQCARFPSPGKLEEAQVRDQLGRRGSCLLDSLVLFQKVLGTADAPAMDQGEEKLAQGYASYWEKCQQPPAPAPVKPKDRDAQQLKTYFRELAVVLEEDCRQKIHQGLDLMNVWGASVSVGARDTLKKATAELEKLK